MFRKKTATMIVALLVAISMLAVACQGAEEPAPEEEPTAAVEDTTEDATESEDAESEDEEPAAEEEEEPTEEPAAEEEEPAEEPVAEEEGEAVELTVWIYESVAGDDASIYDAVADFEAENPNISVELVPIQYGSSSFRDRYITAAQANAGPDVLMSDIIWSPEFAAIGAALPIDDYLPEGKLDEFYPGPVDTLRYEGSVYGFPFYTNALAMFYNKDAFAEAGLPDPADGWTWDEFAEAVEATTDDDTYGFGLLGGWGGTFEWFPFLWSNGGQVLTDDLGQAAFNDEAGLESVQFFMDIITSENVPEAAKAWQGWDEIGAAFSNELIAMYPVGDWGLNTVDEMDPDFEWGVAPLPVAEEPASVVGGANIMINSNTEHPDASYALIEYLTGPVSFEMMDYYNRLSARRGNMDEQQIVQDDPRMAVFVEALEYARARPPIPNWTAVDWDCLQPAFQEILLNDAEIEPTMDQAETCANEALAD